MNHDMEGIEPGLERCRFCDIIFETGNYTFPCSRDFHD